MNTTGKSIIAPNQTIELEYFSIVNINLKNNERVENPLKLDELSKIDKDQITKLCNQCRERYEIFFLPGDTLTSTNSVQHKTTAAS